MTKRQKNDFYPTPEKLALAICKRLAEILPTPVGVIEPSAGTGVFIRAIRQVWPNVLTAGVDIDPDMKQALFDAGANHVYIRDWLEVVGWGFIKGTMILGNPPFSLAENHIAAALHSLQPGDHIAQLLRMSFMGSRERIPFWQKNGPRYLIPLVPRPNFQEGQVDPETGKKKGGDNSEYGVFVWQKGYTGNAELLPTLVWK